MPIVIYKPQNCFPPKSELSRIGFDRLFLKPGTNHLSDSSLSALKAHPDFQSYADRKALVVKEGESETIPLTDTPANLSAYNVDDAEQIIDDTHDVAVLKAWLKAEPRKMTRADLTQRIKDLGGEI